MDVPTLSVMLALLFAGVVLVLSLLLVAKVFLGHQESTRFERLAGSLLVLTSIPAIYFPQRFALVFYNQLDLDVRDFFMDKLPFFHVLGWVIVALTVLAIIFGTLRQKSAKKAPVTVS